MRFPPRDVAADFYNACVKWSPADGTNRGTGALWNLRDALEPMGEAAWFIANGWRLTATRIQEDLGEGMRPEMAKDMAEMWRLYCKAAELAGNLYPNFLKIHADDVAREAQRDAHVADVGARR
jgi:hypothetical protein